MIIHCLAGRALDDCQGNYAMTTGQFKGSSIKIPPLGLAAESAPFDKGVNQPTCLSIPDFRTN